MLTCNFLFSWLPLWWWCCCCCCNNAWPNFTSYVFLHNRYNSIDLLTKQCKNSHFTSECLSLLAHTHQVHHLKITETRSISIDRNLIHLCVSLLTRSAYNFLFFICIARLGTVKVCNKHLHMLMNWICLGQHWNRGTKWESERGRSIGVNVVQVKCICISVFNGPIWTECFFSFSPLHLRPIQKRNTIRLLYIFSITKWSNII